MTHPTYALVEKLSFMTILCHFGRIIPNIHVTLDHFPVTLDISSHFGQCHKRPCFLLVMVEALVCGLEGGRDNVG